jgi:transcription elongation GreA/GreB family factor
MSRAFVKETDGDAPDDGLPERAQSAHPNYVTADGLADLHRQLDESLAEELQLRDRRAVGDLAAKAPLARIARDIRYLRRRIGDAILVEAHHEEVAIGTTVTIDDGAQRRAFTIVGEDEADPAQGKISWTSPLGSALLGQKRGSRLTWRRPVGDVEIVIVDLG